MGRYGTRKFPVEVPPNCPRTREGISFVLPPSQVVLWLVNPGG